MKFIKNFLLACAGIAISLIFGEFAARIALSGVTSTSNMQTWLAQRWQAEAVVKNELGFREQSFSSEKSAGTVRVAIIGDSFTFGQGLPAEQRFSDLLQVRLNQQGDRNFEVLNFGRPGATTIDELDILQESVLPADPDFIFVQWLPNDFEDRRVRWLFSRPHLAADADLNRWLMRNSALYFLLDNVFGNYYTAFNPPETDYAAYLLSRVAPDGAEFEEATQPVYELLSALNSSGIPYEVILHPMLRPGLTDDYNFWPLHQAVLDICVEVQARCTDITELFTAYGPGFDVSQLWVNRFDPHPGAEANQLVADYLYERFADEIRAAN